MTRSFDNLLLISAWTNGWVNNRDVSDLRRHRADYDVYVMIAYEVKEFSVTRYFPDIFTTN